MEKIEFAKARKRLGKTQKELASLLGVSLKAVHSYEQGWRTIPSHVQRQMFFLLSSQRRQDRNLKPCWERKKCGRKEQCPAWEFQAGHLCWFICGTLCDCASEKGHREKLKICQQCEILTALL